MTRTMVGLYLVNNDFPQTKYCERFSSRLKLART